MAVTDAIKLRIYNGALRQIGDRGLSSLEDQAESRRVLDHAWGPSNEVVKWALERGQWKFAIRTIELDYDPSLEPSFGFQRVFVRPDDYRKLVEISADEYMRQPLTNDQFINEGPYWLSDFDVVYVRYVSDGDNYGMDDAAWPEVFKELLELKLADEICERQTNSKAIGDRVYSRLEKALRVARSMDAMQEGAKFFPRGKWSRSRGGYGMRRYE